VSDLAGVVPTSLPIFTPRGERQLMATLLLTWTLSKSGGVT
jgi:hypothetical protein